MTPLLTMTVAPPWVAGLPLPSNLHDRLSRRRRCSQPQFAGSIAVLLKQLPSHSLQGLTSYLHLVPCRCRHPPVYAAIGLYSWYFMDLRYSALADHVVCSGFAFPCGSDLVFSRHRFRIGRGRWPKPPLLSVIFVPLTRGCWRSKFAHVSWWELSHCDFRDHREGGAHDPHAG